MLMCIVVGHDTYVYSEKYEMEKFWDVSTMCISCDHWEPLNRVFDLLPKPSIEEEHKLGLKTFPSYLRYAYLGKDKTLPNILSTDFSESQVETTLTILRKIKEALG